MRKLLTWVLAGVAFLVAADVLLWVLGTRLIASGFDRWAAQLTAQGWTVAAGDRTSFGWPFAASVAMTDIRIAGGVQAIPGGIDWHTSRVVLSVSLWAPATLVIAPEGLEYVRVAHMSPMVFSADRIAASVPLPLSGHSNQGELLAQGLTGGLSASHHPQDVRLESLSAHLQATSDRSGGLEAELDIHAFGIGLPDIGRWPLGANVSVAAASLQVSSPALSRHPAEAGVSAATSEAEAWRAGGGSVSVRDVKLHWGPLSLQGDAKLGLDATLQPAGTGTANVSGTAAAIDALVDGGVVQPGMGATAKAVLGAMAQLPGGDSVRLPFILRDRTLSVGQIPLARLNNVVW